MTHEELLFKSVTSGDTSTSNALRAVVELHKPQIEYRFVFCNLCKSTYPCPTIQAIEKELN
jgi:hypothetical protein